MMYQAPVSTKTPGRRIGAAGFMRLAEEAKKASVCERMRAPSGAEIRSIEELKVDAISAAGIVSVASNFVS